MRGHATLVLCDVCRKAVPDASVKEVIYQAGKLRYRLELCPSCLGAEMSRHDGHRGVPGFRKRAAIVFTLKSADELPGTVEVG